MSRTDESYSFSTPAHHITRNRTANPFTGAWYEWNVYEGDRTGVSGHRSRSGFVTMDYYALSKFGKLPENDFSRSKASFHEWTGSWFRVASASEEDFHGCAGSAFCAIPTLLTLDALRALNQDNKVKQKVLERAKEQSINVGVAAAESNQTAALISSSIRKLAKAYDLARRGDLAGAAAVLGLRGYRPGRGRNRRNAANGWLSLQYGWIPLVHDVYGALQELEKKRGRGEYKVFKSKDGFNVVKDDMVYSTNYIDLIQRRLKYTAVAVIKMTRNDPSYQTLSAVGLTNPALIAWEKVPYSFVLDWFVPVGSFLSQFDSSFGWEYYTGSITRIQELSSKCRRVSNWPRQPNIYRYHVCDGECSQEYFSLTRSNIGTMPGFWTIPYVKSPVSTLHVLNALALLANLKR